jgi:LPXTG-site transpeptidase (sortase) family protein
MKRSLAVLLLVLLSACGESNQQGVPTAGETIPTTTTTTAPPSDNPVGAVAVDDRSDLADLTRPLGSALLEPAGDPAPYPVGLIIDSLDISDAPVIDVGVEANGEMEIPGATQVGWYRFGPSPGESGSAVLAAHIAFNGRDGVFRDLEEIEIGDVVEIQYDDGTSRRFRVTETAQYAKDGLPVERIFAKDGSPELTLITCGGDFNRSLRSYSDNVVAYAEPIDD